MGAVGLATWVGHFGLIMHTLIRHETGKTTPENSNVYSYRWFMVIKVCEMIESKGGGSDSHFWGVMYRSLQGPPLITSIHMCREPAESAKFYIMNALNVLVT